MIDKDKRTARLPWIDGLRFLAAFMVLLSHSRNDFFVKYDQLDACEQGIGAFIFYTAGRLGAEAVWMFFIISGFLVGGIGLERIQRGTFRLKDYAVNRTVRIAMPLIGAIAFYGIVTLFTDAEWSWWRAIGNLLSLQCVFCDPLVSPFWSLSYEVWFYIVLFAVALAFSRHKKCGLLLFVVCCLIFTRLNALYLLCWLMGAVAWLCRPKKGNRTVLAVAAVVMLVCLALSQMASDSHAISIEIGIDRTVVTVLLCFSFCVIVQQATLLPPRKDGSRNWAYKIDRGLSKLADFSYTLYLTHRILFLVVFQYIFEKNTATLCLRDICHYALLVFGALLVAYGIYFLSERHTARVRRWVKARLGMR